MRLSCNPGHMFRYFGATASRHKARRISLCGSTCSSHLTRTRPSVDNILGAYLVLNYIQTIYLLMPYSRTSSSPQEPSPSASKSKNRTTNMSLSGDEQNLTKEEKKRRKAEKKERKKEKKAAKKRKRDSVESAASAANDSSVPTNGGAKKKSREETSSNNGGSSNTSSRARTNSVASVHTHHSVTEDTITERIGANVSSRVVSGDATGSSATSGAAAAVRGAAGGGASASNTASRGNVELLPYRLKKVRSLVSLAPSSLSDVKGNIRRLSCQDVTRYVKGLEGVLMAVREVKVCGPGRVQNELPHVHYQVEADVVVFCPDVGTRLVGVVNESFPSHVGMLVDTLFNAMVPAEELRRLGYEYDMDSNQWSTERDAKSGELLPSPLPISVDDRIGFTVSKLNELNGIISLEGDDAVMQGAEP